MTKLKAIIFDSNEWATAPWLHLLKFDVDVSVMNLPVGDCWLSCEDAAIIVERKTPNDLLASIADGRLFAQVAAMMDASQWCYLVITGCWTIKGHHIQLDYQSTQWNDRSVQGALTDVQELGVRVVQCEGESDYAGILEWLANRERGDKHVKAVRKAVVQTPQEAILCSLPNVQDVRAKALMEHHNDNLARAIVGLTKIETDEHTPGIGVGTRTAVRTVMGLAEDEELFISKGALYRVELNGESGIEGMILADSMGFEAITELAKAIEEAKKGE